jgi:hypothetical protein
VDVDVPEVDLGAGELAVDLPDVDVDVPEVDLGAGAAGTRLSGIDLAAEAAQPDDLRKIEGIGPKISQLMNAAGIYTFAQLASTDVSRLQAILTEAGPRYRLADPTTWPEQARLAADGAWEALSALQDNLKGGRR